MNFGLAAGAAIRILRMADYFVENYCGPIIFKDNIFD